MRVFKYVSPGFFRTAGTRLIAGREITWTEVYGLRPLVVISENLARELWGTPAAAVGKRLRQDPSMPWHEVIGVVQDVHENALYEPAPPIVYWPTMSAFLNGTPERPNAIRGVTFIVRSERTGTEGFLNELRQAVWSVNANLPVSPRTMREVYDQSLAQTSFTLVMLAIAASMALLLGVVGIYGVISYTVSQRRREIGIRAALGAQRGELKGMFVRHALVLAGIGVVIGLGAAAGLTRLMSSLLYGITPLDPVTYVAVPLVLVTATCACQLSARAARGLCGSGGSPEGGVAAIRDIGSCKLKLGGAKLAAGNIDHCVGLAPTSRRHRVVAGGGVLVRFSPADFKCLPEPMSRLALKERYPGSPLTRGHGPKRAVQANL